jgi:prepilin-type N-terminal cleavage/methylation domain-containing protein
MSSALVGRARLGSSRAGGFTLLELMLAMTVLAVAFVAISRAMVGAMSLNRVNRESAIVQDGMREMIETLQGAAPFGEIFIRYNSDPGDDPLLGLSPGDGFAVSGLDPVTGDPDGLVGEIVFPTLQTGMGLELREDLPLPELGLPRDLDGDGDVDNEDHAGDYRLLPVIVRLRWQVGNGERVAEVRTILADR